MPDTSYTQALPLNITQMAPHSTKSGWMVDADTGLTLDTYAVLFQGVIYVITKHDYYWTFEGGAEEMAGMCRYIPVTKDIFPDTFLQLWINHHGMCGDLQWHRREYYLFARVHDVVTRFEHPRLDYPEEGPEGGPMHE